jgi:glycosyltransferase involved in cell wall biosynthesis
VPRVSVIIPCYNAERFVGSTLDSVLAQSIDDWQIVAVDDGSTDRTGTILEGYARRDPRIVAVHQANGGVAAARNKGFALADRSSQYLLFLDSDDILHATMLETLIRFLDRQDNFGVAFCNRDYIDAEGRPTRRTWKRIDRWVPYGPIGRRLRDDEAVTPFVSLFLDGMIVPSCAVLRRAVYEAGPGWDESFGQPYEDTDLFQSLALHSTIGYIPRALVSYRVHAAQSMANQEHVWRQRKRCYEKWKNYARSLPREQRQVIVKAMRFQRRIIPLRHLLWSWDEARNGHLRAAVLHVLRAAKASTVRDLA